MMGCKSLVSSVFFFPSMVELELDSGSYVRQNLVCKAMRMDEFTRGMSIGKGSKN